MPVSPCRPRARAFSSFPWGPVPGPSGLPSPVAGPTRSGSVFSLRLISLFTPALALAFALAFAFALAHELVALYAGRAGQENRLAQLDKELCVERVVSYHLPGRQDAGLRLRRRAAAFGNETHTGHEQSSKEAGTHPRHPVRVQAENGR